MKQIVAILLLFLVVGTASAVPTTAEKLLALVKLAPERVTRDKVVSILGQPGKIEETKRGSKWLYNYSNTTLTMHWNKKSGIAEEFSFTCRNPQICSFDKKNECKLKEGSMSMQQAVSLLGPPHDMTVKSSKQVMYYNYQGNILRLFFRNRVLVDYTLLLGQKTDVVTKAK